MNPKPFRLLLLSAVLVVLRSGYGVDGELVDTPTLYPKTTTRPTATPIPEVEAYIRIDQNNRYIATITTN